MKFIDQDSYTYTLTYTLGRNGALSSFRNFVVIALA